MVTANPRARVPRGARETVKLWKSIFAGCLLLPAILANCGGNSSRESRDGGQSGSGGGGGRGGTSATAGSSPVAGQAGTSTTGGSSSTGGSVSVGGAGSSSGGSSVGGAAGAGPDPDARCRLPHVSGSCLADVPSYWFDATTGVCMPFTYGGCDGNENRFATVEECYEVCGGQGDTDAAACETSFDCAPHRFVERCCSF